MNLFSQLAVEPTHEEIYPGAVLMRGLALPQDTEFFAAIEDIVAAAPLHHTMTPGGLPMGVMVSDCGTPEAFRRRWDPLNPEVRKMWPPMPRVLLDFALRCAVRSGFPLFRPDTCHINRYQAGIFLLGGIQRTDKVKRMLLEHGDVVVWGGPSRMRFHGVLPLKPGHHPLTGPYRFNLTFRKTA